MYKLVAIDLDGTLLNSVGEVSEKTRKILLEAKEKGIEVVLASGRPIDTTKNFALELGVDNYIISGNGAVVYDVKNDEVILDRFISKEQILRIVDICESNSIFYNIYTEDEVITKALSYNVLFYHKENIKKPEEKRTRINVVEDVKKYILESNKDKFLKVTVCDESKMIFNGIIRKLKEIPDIDILNVEHMSKKQIKIGTKDYTIEYHYTEITNKDVNKWTAIEFLMDKLNISRAEVVAIGDNNNDFEMVKNAGLGIVTANGNPYMKDNADVVVADNNSDGVYEAFEKYILS